MKPPKTTAAVEVKPAEDRSSQSTAPIAVETRSRMVTARAVLLALAIIPFNALWVVKMEVTRYAGHPTTISLFFNVVFWLTVLCGINAVVRRIAPRAAFSPGELMTTYILLALASAMAGHDMIEVLTPILSHAAYFATPANGWADKILPYIPEWLTVRDEAALKDFYTGIGSLYDPANYRAWLGPVLCWTGFLTLLGFVMLCLNTLLRRQWTENEKLAYPLVALPLEMVSPRTNLFRTRLFWIGAILAATMQLWNGLAFWYPAIPMLPLRFASPAQDLATYMSARPWNAIGWTPMAVYPFGVALGMLLPVDLLFSSWFFAWVWRMQRVTGAAIGVSDMPGFPYVEAQSTGAYLGIALFSLWISRRHFIGIFNGLFERNVDLGDANEPISYRLAALGIFLGGAGIFVFCRLCGMSPLVILAFFTIYFLIAVAVTRMRAELGPPAHDLHRGGPDTMLPQILGPNQFTKQELGVFSLFYGFNRAYRAHPMPIELEGFKIAEQVDGSFKPLFWVMLLAIFVGCLTGFWANLDQGYRFGAAGRIGPPNVMMVFGGEPYNRMNGWVTMVPVHAEQQRNGIALSIGFFFTLLMNVFRLRFAWFPFHPVGYAVSSSWAMNLLWMPMFVAWFIKLMLLRYGGLKAYRQALPLFLGLILGDCVMGSIWTLVGIAVDVPTYAFWP
jgi:hypothetical protein